MRPLDNTTRPQPRPPKATRTWRVIARQRAAEALRGEGASRRDGAGVVVRRALDARAISSSVSMSGRRQAGLSDLLGDVTHLFE